MIARPWFSSVWKTPALSSRSSLGGHRLCEAFPDPHHPTPSKDNSRIRSVPIIFCIIALMATIIVRELFALLYESLPRLWAPWGQRLRLNMAVTSSLPGTLLGFSKCLVGHRANCCRGFLLFGCSPGTGWHWCWNTSPFWTEEPAVAAEVAAWMGESWDAMGLAHTQLRLSKKFCSPTPRFSFFSSLGSSEAPKKQHVLCLSFPSLRMTLIKSPPVPQPLQSSGSLSRVGPS